MIDARRKVKVHSCKSAVYLRYIHALREREKKQSELRTLRLVEYLARGVVALARSRSLLNGKPFVATRKKK